MTEVTNITYSTNGEEFIHSDLEGAVEMVFDDGEHNVGDTITVYSGTAVLHNASDFMHRHLVDDLADAAYDEAGEWADGWPYATPKQADELNEAVKVVVDAWAIKLNQIPTFSKVTDVKEVKVIITDNDGDFRVA